MSLFKSLQDEAPDLRAIALDRIIEVVKSYARDVYPPPHTPSKRSSVSTETTSPSTPNVYYHNGAAAAKTPVGVYKGIPIAIDGGFIITPINGEENGANGEDSGIGRSGAETMNDWNSITPTMLDPGIIAEIDNEQDEIYEQLQHYLLTILRLSVTCPFKDVRQAFMELLKKLQVGWNVNT
ncbi:hypothetical protein BC938DRAFT_483303 [Jimgerdemannia flammicorona]|uniref:Uncharacterized protein n=1 Tax=Jimgerdemannia flammicorona TaxID=994334 RepID=A0A433QCE4_9FUNG|nr:hypothetical protein BC938DRAFT_483303 [Jimgerdemannia flammicorona]